MSNFEYLLSPINKIKGVGKKTLSSFNKKKIFTIFDLLWHLPISRIETAEDTEIDDLQVGRNYNIKVIPIKYNFPRIRNLPNKVICEKNGVKLDCIFFNSYEGYIKKILPLNEEIIILGKSNNQWFSTTKNNENIKSDMVILCNSLKAVDLLDSLSHNIKLKPVLGQAIEVGINDAEVDLLTLPKQFNINGKNIIPISKNKLIIGSTDEYSTKPEENTFEKLTNFLDKKPTWLMNSQVTKKWFGIRSRPEGEPSPIMKNLGDGLIICTGFYKNGILLAPSCSNWVSKEIKNHLF